MKTKWVTGPLWIDSSQKVNLLQWRLWLAARSKEDRQLPANSGHLKVLCRAS
jgi:hypothetical protein